MCGHLFVNMYLKLLSAEAFLQLTVKCSTLRNSTYDVMMIVLVYSIQKYKDQFSFLRDAKFIRELENDSLDSDIIDEELNALREAAIRSYTSA